MFLNIFPIILISLASAVAQTVPSVVCVAGQCMQGTHNFTIGTTLSSPGGPTDILLLPGQYTTTTNPKLLHESLIASGATLAPSAGFPNASTVTLPLNVALEPGVAIYPSALYSGAASFNALGSATTNGTSIATGSLAVSDNTWVAVSSSANSRVILWDSVPDVSQLSTKSLALIEIQSAACSPVCAGAGVCSGAGTCVCPTGFAGSSCESCAPGFFGPTCQQCAANCPLCDEGISGSGRCLKTVVTNPPSACNCLNGECGGNGQCTCNPGWEAGTNGTACSKCSAGFFQTSTGDCKACQIGCTQCGDGNGVCISCKTGFTQDANDRTKCLAPQAVSSTGSLCPDGSFSSAGVCTPCSPACQTCTGGTSNDCVICGAGKYSFNGACVGVDSNGVCEGSTLVADNIKRGCDTCGAKCKSCGIPNFNAAATVDKLQCTDCLPGSVLSKGQCIESCPTGTFLDTDGLNCKPCDSSCGTCSGSATFCISCSANQLASNGKCVSTCPQDTLASSGSCLTCHPDCASCSGLAFNQCATCPPNRPVLNNGRCLPTCGKTQFFDKTTATCQSCDSSCSSCSSAGPSSCNACSSSTQVLRGGSCVSANCKGTDSVITGLGVCLSELVVEPPKPSGTASAAPLPSITGISTPTDNNTNTNTTTRRPLEWWQILLMALGCAFIFMCFLFCWRRRARKQRAKRTALFAATKKLAKPTWFSRFTDRLFRRKPVTGESEEINLMKLRNAEEARHHAELERHNGEMEKMEVYGAYEYSRAGSPPPRVKAGSSGHRLSDHSMYSQVTGIPRRAPEPRQPVKNPNVTSTSRFSTSTLGSSVYARRVTPPLAPSPAEEYASSIRQPVPTGSGTGAAGSYWTQPVQPTPTGGSGSKNPFLNRI